MSIIKGLLTAFSYLVFTLVFAYGFSGWYLINQRSNDDSEKHKALMFGLFITLIFVVAIPLALFLTLVYWGNCDATEFGRNSLWYVILIIVSWILGLIIRISSN